MPEIHLQGTSSPDVSKGIHSGSLSPARDALCRYFESIDQSLHHLGGVSQQQATLQQGKRALCCRGGQVLCLVEQSVLWRFEIIKRIDQEIKINAQSKDCEITILFSFFFKNTHMLGSAGHDLHTVSKLLQVLHWLRVKVTRIHSLLDQGIEISSMHGEHFPQLLQQRHRCSPLWVCVLLQVHLVRLSDRQT